MQPFTVSNDVLSDREALRGRMQQDGYLFFQGLLSPVAIASARVEILQQCRKGGWLKEGTEDEAAISAPDVRAVEPEPEFMKVYLEILKGEAFHALALDSGLLTMLETLFGETPLAHARNIARIIFPQNTQYTTPSHQDYIHIQGTEETYTVWIPLGDCPKELGSLAVMQGSHRDGLFPVESAYGAGGVGIQTEKLPYTWVGSDFQCGDVIVFHSLTVHKALPNLSPDRMRLSVDFRYQPLSHPVDASSFQPHHNRQTWEEIYADWKEETGKYYWKDMPVHWAERNARVAELRSAAGKG